MDFKKHLNKSVSITWKDAYLSPNSFHSPEDVSALDDFLEIITTGVLIRVSRASVFISNEHAIVEGQKYNRGITCIPRNLITEIK